MEREKNTDKFQEERQKDLIIGRNAVTELLKSGREIDTLFVARGEKGGTVGRIIAECKEKGAVVKDVDRKKLDFMCGKGNHQRLERSNIAFGVILLLHNHFYCIRQIKPWSELQADSKEYTSTYQKEQHDRAPDEIIYLGHNSCKIHKKFLLIINSELLQK